jgi:hypothetical protein
MYGFRKPVDALTFPGQLHPGTGVELKTACVIGQIVGYLISKFIGARVCAETPRAWRAVVLVAAVLGAELALVLFAVAPAGLKPLALFLNGLPLGIVWGLVVRYLEGRRASDLLLVALGGSFVIAGATAKDVGLWLLGPGGILPDWVPALAGAMFLLPYVVAVLVLDRLPPPTPADVADRSLRADLDRIGRQAFLRRLGWTFPLLLAAYVLLTAYRDYRDHYGRELFIALGHLGDPGQFLRADRWAFVGALAALAGLALVRDHRRAVAAVLGLVLAGFALVGLATVGFRLGRLDGPHWMAWIGVGLYVAYVPFGVVLFERMVAALRFPGTSVFAVQLADGVGYSGSVLLQVYRDLAHPDLSRLDFFVPMSYAVAGGGLGLTVAAGIGLERLTRRTSSADRARPDDQPPRE